MIKGIFSTDKEKRLACLTDLLEMWSELIPVAFLIVGGGALLIGTATHHWTIIYISVSAFAVAGIARWTLSILANRIHTKWWTMHTASWPRELRGY